MSRLRRLLDERYRGGETLLHDPTHYLAVALEEAQADLDQAQAAQDVLDRTTAELFGDVGQVEGYSDLAWSDWLLDVCRNALADSGLELVLCSACEDWTPVVLALEGVGAECRRAARQGLEGVAPPGPRLRRSPLAAFEPTAPQA